MKYNGLTACPGIAMANRTALYDQHLKLGARLVDFHGWMLPVQYQSIIAEHSQCRSAAAVFDTGHMGQICLTGTTAAAELSNTLTQDASALGVGQCRYGFLLDDRGGIIDDTILMRLGQAEFLLVVNAATLEGDLAWLKGHLSGGVDMRCPTIDGTWGKLDLQGPKSSYALQQLAGGGNDLPSLDYFHVTRAALLGRQCIVSRTGYTGELGYEIFAPSGDIEAIFAALLANPAVKPAGLGARDLLRLEMGYPLYGQDISRQVNPLDAGLGAFVDLSRQFIGSQSLREVARRGVRRQLVAFRTPSRKRPQTGQTIAVDHRVLIDVGEVTSGGFSPSLGVSIGMGYVAADFAREGQALVIRASGEDLAAVVAAKPLYRQGTCRINIASAAVEARKGEQ